MLISEQLLLNYPDSVATLFRLLGFVPGKIWNTDNPGILEYAGFSPFFASLDTGDRLPLYEATVTDGKASVRKVEEK
jgi:hypothetical protein